MPMQMHDVHQILPRGAYDSYGGDNSDVLQSNFTGKSLNDEVRRCNGFLGWWPSTSNQGDHGFYVPSNSHSDVTTNVRPVDASRSSSGFLTACLSLP
jgi:hypothetical protein